MHTLMYILTQNSAASAFFQKEEKVHLYCERLILNDRMKNVDGTAEWGF